jgi:sugar phosphate permease
MAIYGLPVFSVAYGLDWIASAPPKVRLLTGVVGTERIGIMVAWITAIRQVGGSASAAYFAGVLRIAFRHLFGAFIISGMLLIAAAIMVLFVSAGGPVNQREVTRWTSIWSVFAGLTSRPA